MIEQGVINGGRISVSPVSFPDLNMNASHIDKEGIGIEFGSTQYFGDDDNGFRMQDVLITVNTLQTLDIAQMYRDRLDNNPFLGDVTVKSCSSTLKPFIFNEVSVVSLGTLTFNNENARFPIILRGYYRHSVKVKS